MEGAAFAALTLNSILANSIGHEPENMASRESLHAEDRGTWVLSLPPVRAAGDVGLKSAAFAGLIPVSPHRGKLFGERFDKPGALAAGKGKSRAWGRRLMLKRRLTRSC
jgi:hypothetical protein